MKDEILKNKLDNFISRFEKEDENIKKMVHFNSVKNITTRILTLKKRKTILKYKESILTYLTEVELMNFPIDKFTSETLYHKYIFESGRLLMYKSNFKTNGSLFSILVFGILIDLLIYYFDVLKFGFYFPIITISSLIYGFIIRKKAINENRYFTRNW